MREFHISVDIQAPPDRVWSVMRDGEHWPEWTPTVTSVKRLDRGPLAVGSRVLIRQPKLPPAVWRITNLDDTQRSFTWVSRAPGVVVTACHSVTPQSGGCRARLSIQYSGVLSGLLAWLTRGVNDPYLALEAKGLKERCERPTTVPA